MLTRDRNINIDRKYIDKKTKGMRRKESES